MNPHDLHSSVTHGLLYYFGAFGFAAALGLALCVIDYVVRKIYDL